MASKVSPRLILLTGPPGIGKTTLMQKACSALKENNVPVQGFFTEEVRSGAHRIGFDVVTLCGKRSPLARVQSFEIETDGVGDTHKEPKVGQYNVKLRSFEQSALPVLHISPLVLSSAPVIIIDEIGKMELFSHTFVQTVRSLVSNHKLTILATIPIQKGRPIPLVEELRSSKDAQVFEISRSNRDSILPNIITAIQLSRKS